MNEQINQIFEFWFGTETDELQIIAKQSGLWWGKDANTDDSIKNKFGAIYQSAVDEALKDWLKSARGQLALIILLDQFSRVIYRDTADAFAQDRKALRIVLEGINSNVDLDLRPIERVFYYMPMEHSEDIEIQSQCVRYYQKLVGAVPDITKNEFQGYLQFAEKHRVIIERFNRFPHRNKVLNRISSAEEQEFLTQPGSSF